MAVELSAGTEFQMWVVFALILGALVFYLFEHAAMEMTSLGIICLLLIFFHFFPSRFIIGSELFFFFFVKVIFKCCSSF